MIYLDTAALLKLIHPEPEADALQEWLDARPGAAKLSSTLIEVELIRGVRRTAPQLLDQVGPILARVNRFAISRRIRETAASFPDRRLRSLDAIHLATALAFGENLDAFVSYDRRLLAAAEGAGLPTASPGVDS